MEINNYQLVGPTTTVIRHSENCRAKNRYAYDKQTFLGIESTVNIFHLTRTKLITDNSCSYRVGECLQGVVYSILPIFLWRSNRIDGSNTVSTVLVCV